MWSKKYDKCIMCGTTEKKHKGNGKCCKCNQKYHREKNIERYKEYSKKYYKKNPEKMRGTNRKSYKKNQEKNIEKARNYRISNPEKAKEISKRYREANREELRERSKVFRELNPEKIKEQNKKWADENPIRKKEYMKKWAKANPVRRREYATEWAKKNPEMVKLSSKKKYEKRRNSIHYKLRDNISGSIYRRLKRRLSSKKCKSTFDFLPYTINDLMQHLEKLFTTGMTWQNHSMFGWHIDHIRPDCSFNYKNVEDKEFQKCWALSNLRPLWWKDNLRKSGKLNY